MLRRSFLQGVLALTAAAAAGPQLALAEQALPTIYGDGVHDDWAGLQAMFSGKPFRVDNEVVVAEEGVVHGGNFLLSRPLRISGDRICIAECRFTARDWKGGGYLLMLTECTNTVIANCVLDVRAIDSIPADVSFSGHAALADNRVGMLAA